MTKYAYKFFLALILLQSLNANALSRNGLASCDQGAKTYSSYAVYLDNYLLKAIADGYAAPNNVTVLYEKVKISHEDFKNKEADKLFKVMKELIAEGSMREETEVWRSFMEMCIDYAYIEAFKNMKAGSLGKSVDYYERKIYDDCVHGLR